MFGGSKRHRPPPPLTSATANPNASTAASSAFMSAGGAKPNQSLSSAAAAAALKARPTTPTNVSEVQTKRTLSRSGSVSSLGSTRQSRGRASPASSTRLQRRGSNSSMTDRSFRSPSPHGVPVAAEPDAPPVPELPSDHRGVGMQAFRTASQKIKSQPPSYYGQPSGDTRNVRKSDSMLRKVKPAPDPPQPEPEERVPSRSESRNSVNFSYPISFRGQSPPASPIPTQNPRHPVSPQSSRTSRVSASNLPEAQMVYDANSRRMVPQYSGANTEQRGIGGSARQSKDAGAKKKGSTAAKNSVTRAELESKDLKSSDPDWSSAHRKDKGKQKATQVVAPSQSTKTDDPDSEAEFIQQRDDYQDMNENPVPASEGSEGSDRDLDEEEVEAESHTPLSQKVLDALDAVPTRQTVYDSPSAAPETPKKSADRPDSQVISELSADSDTQYLPNKIVAGISAGGTGVRRSDSTSPGRQTRFASSPAESLTVKHSPLPRSASPIKSAMKRGGISSRDASPSDGGSHTTGARDTSPHVGPVPVMPRKKSVRVSFDDRSTMIVGESAPEQEVDSPVVPSPQQAKKPWYSNIGRSKKKEVPLDDDEIMKPRPALPSFGSIRAKKSREPEERPLVQPFKPPTSEASSPATGPDITNPTGNDGVARAEELSAVNTEDLPSASTSAQISASRNGNAANISRFREPLPPVVTSVEGTGYCSDPIASTDSDDLFDSVLEDSDAEVESSTQATLPTAQENSQNGPPMVEDKVLVTSEEQRKKPEPLPESLPNNGPDITVTQPSPRIAETPGESQGLNTIEAPTPTIFDVPGGFPTDEPSSDEEFSVPSASHDIPAASPGSTESAVVEPPSTIQPGQEQLLPKTTLATTTPVHDVDSDSVTTGSDGSIYSDAYEDQSEMEGDGFMSLDAVVETTVAQPDLPVLAELPGEASPRPRTGNDEVDEVPAAVASKITANPGPPQSDADWEQAKVFWRSLSAEKRRQLEQEAIEEAGEEGDREEVSLPTRRPSKKRRSADQKQLNAIATAQTSKAKGGPEKSLRPSSSVNKTEQVGQSDPPRMRASMRQSPPNRTPNSDAAPGAGMRKTMRSPRESQSGGPPANGAARSSRSDTSSKTSRPHSAQIGTGKMASSNAAGSALAKALESSRPRRGSDASDSSFQRVRPSSSGGHAFRRSMRPMSSAGPAPSSADTTKGSGRFSLRSLSPTGSAFRRNSIVSEPDVPPAGTMRRTMRSARSGSFTSQETKRPSMHIGFGRSKAPKPTQFKKSNRFADSSDEDEGGPSLFRSRFNESSDEEDAPQQGPSVSGGPLARGTLRTSTSMPSQRKRTTPVPEVDEDSPELPDSDDDKQGALSASQTSANPRAAMIRSNSGTNSLTGPGSRSGHGGFSTTVSGPPSPREKRGSFMGSILKRNKRADQTGKIQRSEFTESAARRDTKLERHADQLRGLRGDQPSPKLQKRGSIKNQDGWPFPELEDSQDAARPNSAGNPVRPTLEGRRSTSLGLPNSINVRNEMMMPASANVAQSDAGDMAYGNQRKKKKFGTLRRMFRLND